jgi:peptide methionine sulfoxide reductase msrA/msrB
MKIRLILMFVALVFGIMALSMSKTDGIKSSMDKQTKIKEEKRVDKSNLKEAYFAGGCFWGVEHLMQSLDGVDSAVSGYMGGATDNPTYEDVIYKNTKHLETVKVSYDPAIIEYEKLAKFFFEIHDPTQANGQGPDIGEQYLSAIFYSDNDEKEILENLITILKNKGYKVVTKLISANATFWNAEDYHQDYYEKTKKTPYCHSYQKKF